MPFQIRQRHGQDGFAKFLRHHLRVRVADAKRDERAEVAEYRLPDRFGQLGNVLVRQLQAEPVFARLRQNRRECIGREVLELINE